MSRYNVVLSREVLELAIEATNKAADCSYDLTFPTIEVPENYSGKVAIGYDRPCYFYFIDFYPDCEVGYYYGYVGLNTQVGRWALFALITALVKLTSKSAFREMADAISLDIPF